MASETVSLNTKMDAQEKRLFVETAESLGLSPSGAVRVFVRKFNEYGGFPFAVKREYPMSSTEKAEIATLNKALDDGTAITYSSFTELLAEVDEEIQQESIVNA